MHRRWVSALLWAASSAFPAALHEVLILRHGFEPETVVVRPGDTVQWIHRDAAPHTVTGNGAAIWESGEMTYGDVYRRVFPDDGSFDYVCLLHPMTGRVTVGEPVGIRAQRGASTEQPASTAPARDVLGRRTGDAGGRAPGSGY